MSDDETKVWVRCRDCSFERLVSAEDAKPAEVLIEHGDRTGHTLTIDHGEE
jgi:hypothetical protein